MKKDVRDINCRLMYRLDGDNATKEDKAKKVFGFKNVECEFLELGDYLENNCSYSAGLYTNGKRNNSETDISSQDMIILDVDDGTKLVDAITNLSEYHCLFHTTRNHKPEVKDKFRIFIPLAQPIGEDLDKVVFKEMMLEIGKHFSLVLDESCFDKSRFFESVSFTKIYYMYEMYPDEDGIVLNMLDVKPIISFVKRKLEKRESRQKARSALCGGKSQHSSNSTKQWTMEEVKELDGYKKRLEPIKNGTMNKAGYTLGKYLMEFGFSIFDVSVHLEELKTQYYTGDYEYGMDYWERYLQK